VKLEFNHDHGGIIVNRVARLPYTGRVGILGKSYLSA
jgi:hypothetical protein